MTLGWDAHAHMDASDSDGWASICSEYAVLPYSIERIVSKGITSTPVAEERRAIIRQPAPGVHLGLCALHR